MERQQDQQFLNLRVQSIAANLGEIQIDLAVDSLCNILVACERYVAESNLGVARRVDVIVLDPARCRDGGAGSFDESRQRPRDAKPSSSQILLRKKNAVNETTNVVLEQYVGELLTVNRPLLQTAECFLQPAEELLILSFQEVWTVDSM